MRQKSWFFGKDFFHVTDLHSSPKTKTTILQWFQRRVLGFLKMDKVEFSVNYIRIIITENLELHRLGSHYVARVPLPIILLNYFPLPTPYSPYLQARNKKYLFSSQCS